MFCSTLLFHIHLHAGSYDVQSCDVHTDLATILVECKFVINSIAAGVVVILDEQGHTAAIRPLHRLSDNKGSVDITGLPAGDYRVKVFDDYLKNISAPAYEHNTLLAIVLVAATDSSPVNTLSAFAALDSGIYPALLFILLYCVAYIVDLTFPSASSVVLISVTPSVVSKSTCKCMSSRFVLSSDLLFVFFVHAHMQHIPAVISIIASDHVYLPLFNSHQIIIMLSF